MNKKFKALIILILFSCKNEKNDLQNSVCKKDKLKENLIGLILKTDEFSNIFETIKQDSIFINFDNFIHLNSISESTFKSKVIIFKKMTKKYDFENVPTIFRTENQLILGEEIFFEEDSTIWLTSLFNGLQYNFKYAISEKNCTVVILETYVYDIN